MYQRIQKGKVGAVKALFFEAVVITGICFAITRKLGSLVTAIGIVVGSWGMNYIFRKRDVEG